MRRVILLALLAPTVVGCTQLSFAPPSYGGAMSASARARRAQEEIAEEQHQREHEAMLRATWGIESAPVAPRLAPGAAGSASELGTWDH